MKKHLRNFILRIPLNYFANQAIRTRVWGKPNPDLFRNLFSSCLNSNIIISIIQVAGNFFQRFWHKLIKWNLGSFCWTILLAVYRIVLQPLLKILLKHFQVLVMRCEQKMVVFQEYFYGEMEDLFNYNEPGEHLYKIQCNNGRQVDYQYEIAWVERTFVIIQVVELFLRYFAHRTLATFEKAWIELNKFQNRSKPALVMEMPEFEITNPEIFNSKPDSLKSKIKNWIPGLRQPAQHTINHTLQRNAKIVSVSENHFSIKIFGINLHQHLMDIQIGNASISRIHFRIKNIINQLVKSKVNCKISELFRFFKPKGCNKIFHSIFNRRL